MVTVEHLHVPAGTACVWNSHLWREEERGRDTHRVSVCSHVRQVMRNNDSDG
jgi:hypothetical protein